MKHNELQRIVSAGRRMYEGGLATGALGTIGVRLSDGTIAVTGERSRLGFLEEADLALLDGNGVPAPGSDRETGQDANIVSAVMAARPEAGSVIRFHSPYATALAHAGRRPLEDYAALLEHLGGVYLVPYYRPGTAGLAGAVAEVMRRDRVALIERQGPVVWGRDVEDAVDQAEAVEAAAKVIFILQGNNGARR
ncbi:MAG: class II aldolase/adducin family protein [Actinobacteria bacterium]|nr:class II aldolase/adducin family protein [Actinomycetota bacterium]MBU1945240.1 class II aldolase/adducin family protein [Actinomycetota bacterium]MBU2687812.1 class II aldolase/adducin family protein [Actinomycetota bacterium]